MWRGGKSGWTCAVKERGRNKERMRLGASLIGREHQFPAPREAVLAFVQNLKEAHGTHE
jgi:hypothetical protein